jgi:NADPH2:quinone reductase
VALVGITAHLGLFRTAGLRAEEVVFVSGGSGGVGSMVIQMAVAVGARVITTAGSGTKAAHCKRLGAERVILYKEESIAEAVKAFAPEGLDLWWEVLRSPDFNLAVSLLAKRGRMVIMAGRDAHPPFPVGAFYTHDLTLHGFAMFNATTDEQRAAAQDINRWLAEGKLRANIDRVLSLDEAADAHRLQEANTVAGSGELQGKIVLRP